MAREARDIGAASSESLFPPKSSSDPDSTFFFFGAAFLAAGFFGAAFLAGAAFFFGAGISESISSESDRSIVFFFLIGESSESEATFFLPENIILVNSISSRE